MKRYWAILVGVLFLVPELANAVDRKKGGTFSEWIWDVFAIRIPNPRFAFLRRFILAGMLWSLVPHFFFVTSSIPVIVFGVGVAWAIYYHHRVEMKLP